MPRSALTGTEKKIKKATLKSAKEREEVSLGAYKKGVKSLEDIQKGKGALPSDLGDIQSRYARALKGAKNMFKDQKTNAIAEYQETYAPQVRGTYGAAAGQGSRSSALNQALAAAQVNLTRGLNADYETLRNSVATNTLNTSQQGKLANLNANLSASSGLTNQGVNPVSQGLSQQAQYLPSSGNQSFGKRLTGALIDEGAKAAASWISRPDANLKG